MPGHLKLPSLLFLLTGVFFLTSCGSGYERKTADNKKKVSEPYVPKVHANKARNLHLQLAEFGLCDVSRLDPTIWFDMKYHSSDNFMRQQLYQTINRPFLQWDVAIRLVKCSELLRSIDTSLHLLIYDAVRPVSVQRKMWKALDSLPPVERVKFVSNPKNKSLHNYGAAVDLTICRSDRSVLDMGAGFDDIRLIAYPSEEVHFLSTGELTKEQWKNRRVLRRVMRSQNFRNLPTEWWHFNACPRWKARSMYHLLEKEPIIR
jgi:D-alanyl-D-alanine dipeptidase